MSQILNALCAVAILTGAITFAHIGGQRVTFVGGVAPAHHRILSTDA